MSKKIAYPTPTTGKQHAALITRLRQVLDEVAAKLDISPSAAADVGQQIGAFAQNYGIAIATGPTSVLVSNGAKLSPVTVTGTSGTFVTFTVAGGTITAIARSTT